MFSEEEESHLTQALEVYLQNKREFRKTLSQYEREMREVAANPPHPVNKNAFSYRTATVEMAQRKLVVIAELRKRMKGIK